MAPAATVDGGAAMASVASSRCSPKARPCRSYPSGGATRRGASPAASPVLRVGTRSFARAMNGRSPPRSRFPPSPATCSSSRRRAAAASVTRASGRSNVSVDVIMDRLNMCHVLDFRERIDRMPHTLDVTDLLLTKLQIVELNRKDLHDIVHLLSAFEVRDGDDVGAVGLARIGKVVGDDW